MKQILTTLFAVYVIVYVCLRIYKKPNFEFFLSTNQLPSNPRFVRADFSDGGINVTWSHPTNNQNVSHYEIYVEDIRNRNNKIDPVIVRGTNNATNPRFLVRNTAILPGRQYRVFMRTVNNIGRSSVSNRVITAPPRNTGSNPDISGGTAQTLDEDTKRFKEQEAEQNIQNREISDLKKRVDALRNDIVIMKNKDAEESKTIYNQVGMDDSLSQIPQSVRNKLGIPSEIDFNFTIDPTL